MSEAWLAEGSEAWTDIVEGGDRARGLLEIEEMVQVVAVGQLSLVLLLLRKRRGGGGELKKVVKVGRCGTVNGSRR